MNNGLTVNLEPGDIEKMVADAIMDSAIGETLKGEVIKAIKSLGDWNSPLKTAIAAHIQKIVMEVVTKEYDNQIREAVRAHLTDAVVESITQGAWDAFTEKLDKVQRDRY